MGRQSRHAIRATADKTARVVVATWCPRGQRGHPKGSHREGWDEENHAVKGMTAEAKSENTKPAIPSTPANGRSLTTLGCLSEWHIMW